MKKIFKSLFISLIVFAGVLSLTGCGKDEKTLVGSWKHGSYVYTFKEDKTGTYNAGGTEMEFTYKDDGKKVSILYKGNTSPLELEYKIEGKKLTIKDSFGSDVEYERK